MRPVNKGESPYKSIADYSEAQPYLEKKIGCYCSYCELPLKHIPHVEHKESKNSGGALTDWKNLLLACTYCNSRKLEKIKKGDSNLCIWPDSDNTFLSFSYENGVPCLNDAYLLSISEAVFKKAAKLYEVVGLNNPPNANDKDRRWLERLEVFRVAKEMYTDWLATKSTEYKVYSLNGIKQTAIHSGFFSIWMTVFKNEKDVLKILIEAFPGTATDCFDQNYTPKRREAASL